ncbi:MAG: T9SS type A sorting domain-containing protein, partial [Saprospiraceae bacterium]
ASAVHIPGTGVPLGICGFIEGGRVTVGDGDTETKSVMDGEDDGLSFASTAAPEANGHSFTYVVTDADGMILGIPPANQVNFDPAGLGTCLVYGLSYTGSLNIAGGDILDAAQAISDDCFSLSSNFVSVNRISGGAPTAQFFASSNNSGKLGVFDLVGDNVLATENDVLATDADGIFYDTDTDVLYQVNRTDNRVDAYANAATNPTLIASSTSDFSNGRELTVFEDKLVVAQDANDGNGNQNRLLVYTLAEGSITLDKIFEVEINLWGIQANGTQLIAIVDNSDEVAIFDDFFAQAAGALQPTAIVVIEDMIRTHGLHYVADRDMMFLTDVGAASRAGDGAFLRIRNWTGAIADGTVSSAEQFRVSGGTSMLGNPVDITYDSNSDVVFVAERANGGGRILGFENPVITGGDVPLFNYVFPGASAVHLPSTSGNLIAEDTPEFLATTPTNTVTKLFPVPVTNELNMVIDSEYDQDVIVSVVNAAGSVVLQQNTSLYNGRNTLRIPTAYLPHGIYFVQIPGAAEWSKFVKQ